jgi:hypothetical protein
MNLPFALLAGWSLAACAPIGAPAQQQMPNDETPPAPEPDLLMVCDASPVQHLRGTRWDEMSVKDLRDRTGASSVRVIRPGDPVSHDFQTARLNVELAADGRIARLTCG